MRKQRQGRYNKRKKISRRSWPFWRNKRQGECMIKSIPSWGRVLWGLMTLKDWILSFHRPKRYPIMSSMILLIWEAWKPNFRRIATNTKIYRLNNTKRYTILKIIRKYRWNWLSRGRSLDLMIKPKRMSKQRLSHPKKTKKNNNFGYKNALTMRKLRKQINVSRAFILWKKPLFLLYSL